MSMRNQRWMAKNATANSFVEAAEQYAGARELKEEQQLKKENDRLACRVCSSEMTLMVECKDALVCESCILIRELIKMVIND